MFDKVDRQRQTLIATTESFDEILISFAIAASPNFFLQHNFFLWNQFSAWLKNSQHENESRFQWGFPLDLSIKIDDQPKCMLLLKGGPHNAMSKIIMALIIFRQWF